MNLFDGIHALYRKDPLPDPPSGFMLHRFLASEQKYAPFCKEISCHIVDNDKIWAIWQYALPKAAKAPYLKYAAPKKTRPDKFVDLLSDRLGISLEKTQDLVELIDLADARKDVAHYYGIDIDG